MYVNIWRLLNKFGCLLGIIKHWLDINRLPVNNRYNNLRIIITNIYVTLVEIVIEECRRGYLQDFVRFKQELQDVFTQLEQAKVFFNTCTILVLRWTRRQP